TQQVTNDTGCESTLTIIANVVKSTSETIEVTNCNVVSVNGIDYTKSGTYTQILKNAAGCDSTLTIIATITGEQPPVIISEASNKTVECGENNMNELNAWLETIGETGQANVEYGNITWSNNFTELTPSCGDAGSVTVTFTATDECGNTSETTATFTIEDTTAPILNCSMLTVYTDKNGTYELNNQDIKNLIGSVTDNCTPSENINIELSTNSFECTQTRMSEGISVTVTATDLCGNVATCTTSVSVIDTIAPTAICNDLTVQLTADGNAVIAVEDVDNGSFDNCSIDTMFIDVDNFDCSNIGENEITLTVIDASGNTATCTSIVTVEAGEANCGQIELYATPDILTLAYCEGHMVIGTLDLLSNDIGINSSEITISTSNLPDFVNVNLTDGTMVYTNNVTSEAVITFTYTICDPINPDNCSEAEVTIRLLKDSDCDGIEDEIDIDDDNDGITDEDEGDRTVDTDNDGIWDSLDIDSDNDGITDNVEWQSTLDEGGDYNYIAPLGKDENGNGWDAAYDPEEGGTYYEAWDTDLDGKPDYLDTDSDNDEVDDYIEGNDLNYDQIADILPLGSDSDNDGLDDAYDNVEGWSLPFNETGSNMPLQDSDSNGVRDWRDPLNDVPPPPPTQECEYQLFVPDGFSPNGDNVNEYFVITLYCDNSGIYSEGDFYTEYPNAKIEIFNRWGNKIYEKENYGNTGLGATEAWWDGRANVGWTVGSDILPAGTYYYILDFNDGKTKSKAGYIFLNR
ncbi:MAG: gliding motility-associated C-terminal domain-containing protein, partial [Draconibacterium sp.]